MAAVLRHRADGGQVLPGQRRGQRGVDVLPGNAGHLDFFGPANEVGPADRCLSAAVGKRVTEQLVAAAIGDQRHLFGNEVE